VGYFWLSAVLGCLHLMKEHNFASCDPEEEGVLVLEVKVLPIA
jgi:hypothetical protein